MSSFSQQNPQGQLVTSFPGRAFNIVPDADINLVEPCTIYVGTGGDVAVIPQSGGESVIFRNLPSGAMVPCIVSRVLPEGTTASDLVGVY